jgi:acetolactate decarboxylase
MPSLVCDISESLMRAMTVRRQRTGETVSHVVMTALAEALGVPHATMFQVSTAGALVEGVFDGVVTVGALREHGDTGLGTFDGLDGEMVAVDGRFYRAAPGGAVTLADDDATVPFAVVTRFHADRNAPATDIGGFGALAAALDALRATANMFCAARVEGRFAFVRTRAAARARAGETLVEATARQTEAEFRDVDGTMVGFWSPGTLGGLNVPGWHLHFLTAARDGGGHVLDCRSADLRLMTQELPEVRIAMPETEAFLRADLTRDPTADLNRAERAR